ncbi:hypothetical protein [Streptomyces sp. V1I1]|uniref:hypothetical protein n=1 Tax=Streptomyces sp. V1I1 TaxID=3042272 RepID=UPI00277F244F|nr:hypothetical protein [Streptomyces sp. V1I1]MDQ0941692.1 hypothetical protein [Streptomyces sp. V1I1]
MHKRVRTSVVAAGLVAALALTGCSSGDNDSGKDKTSAKPTETGGGDGDGAAASGSIEGAWAGVTDGKTVALSVSGKIAAVVADGHVCTGQVTDHGKPMLSLKCADGNTDRTMGSIESNDGTTLVVSWDAGAKDTLTKTDPGKLPTGLPTGIPTP